MATKKKHVKTADGASRKKPKKSSETKSEKKSKDKSKDKSGKRPAKTKSPAATAKPVKTGKGPAPLEVGSDLVKLVRSGQSAEVETKWWGPGLVSVEGLGVSMEWAGRKAAHQKGAEWEADHVVHGLEVEGPFVGASGFAVRFRMDIETRSTGQREMMEEIGVYTVRDGKIVREEFMYRAG